LVGALALISLVAFEAMAVAAAMPVVARELGGVRYYGLAFTSVITASLVGLVFAGAWVDRVGVTWPLLTAQVMFASGLAMAGFAGDFAMLTLGRALAGLAGGLEAVAVYVLVAKVYPAALRARVFAAFSAAWVLPSLIGPAIAGWLAQAVTWRAVFLLVVPLALLPAPVLWRAMRAVDSSAPQAPAASIHLGRRLGRGLALGISAAVAQLGGQLGAGRIWGVPGVGFAAVGMIGVLICLRGLMPEGITRVARGLPSVMLVRGLICGAYFGAETFIPLMLVSERGLSPVQAGVAVTAGAVGWSSGSWFQGRPWCPWSRRRLLVTGSLVVATGIGALTALPGPTLSPWAAAGFWSISGIGMGMTIPSTGVLTLSLSAADEQGRHGSALNLADALGSLFGVGIAGAVFAAGHRTVGPEPGLYVVIWALICGFAVLAALVSGRTTSSQTTTRIR
jgi:MFS family permease